ncbi:MAG TPA: serine protease [Candidatus Paceibacterota bacterium]|nr:serine protease [Candidatus Paceibacterota bacterium]
MARAYALGILSFLLLLPGTTFAAPVDDVAAATVNVYCTYKSGSRTYSTTGSGFFIDSRGIIMTNAHVAVPFLLTDKKGKTLSDCDIRTGSPAKDRYEARVLYISPEWLEENVEELKKGRPRGTGEGDFALLQVTAAVKGSLPTSFASIPVALSGNVLEGDTLIAAGYPAEKLSFKEVQKKLKLETTAPTLTSVRYYVRPYADLIVLSPSKLSASGASGGPIATADGRAIAITTAVEEKKNQDERSLRAITLSYVDRVLLLDVGKPLSLMLLSDLEPLVARTSASLSEDLLTSLRKALLKRR